MNLARSPVDSWRRDAAYGLRCVFRKPAFSLPVLLSLTLGVGVNVALFSFLDALFWNPLPQIHQPDRVVSIYSRSKGESNYLPISHPNYRDLVERTRSLASTAAYQAIWVTFTGGESAEQIVGQMVSKDYFDVLGVDPALGRHFLPEENAAPGSGSVVVLSHGLWQRQFAGAPDVLGRGIELNGYSFTVVGVAEKGFLGTNSLSPAQLWVPMSMYRQVFTVPEMFDTRSGRILQMIGRLKQNVSVENARRELEVLATRLEEEFPDDNRGQTLTLVPLDEANVHPGRRAHFFRFGILLLAVVGILLLTACANVANLILGRIASQRQELAIRAALGASTRRLARQVSIESLLLATLGGLCGLAAAWGVWKLLWAFRPPYLGEDALSMSLDLRWLGFGLLLTVGTALAMSACAVARLYALPLASELGTRAQSPGSAVRVSAHSVLVVVQVTFCAVALVCSGYFLSSLSSAYKIDPGFATDRLLTLSFELAGQDYDEAEGREMLDRIRDRAGAVPGVVSASLGENRLLGGFRLLRNVRRDRGDEDDFLVGSSLVDERYFRTVGIPLVAGRGFGEGDRAQSQPVAIVNEALARRLWPDRSPLGERMLIDDEEQPYLVVGVAANSKYVTLGEAPRPFLYLSSRQGYSPRATLHVRTAADPGELLGTVRREVQALDEDLALVEVQTISETIEQSLWAPRTNATILGVFGALALALAIVGVYGVVTRSVSQRSFEIGIRLALGARRSSVALLVVRQAVAIVIVGILAGLLLSTLARSWLVSSLYEVGSSGLWIFLAVALCLLSVGIVASMVPATRALGIDPASSLKCQ